MSRITVSTTEEVEEIIEEKVGDGTEYESKSEFVRECIIQYEDAENLKDRVGKLEEEVRSLREERDRLQEEVDRVDDLEQKVERLQNEKQMLIEKREERKELQRYVQEERTYRNAGLKKRLKWWAFGKPSEA